MEDIFATIHEEQTPIEMPYEEFVKKSKKLLGSMIDEYAQCWYKQRLKEKDYNLTPCNGCKGEGEFERDNEEKRRCIADQIEGECYEELFDEIRFVDFMENQVFWGSDFWDLINCNVLPSQRDKTYNEITKR